MVECLGRNSCWPAAGSRWVLRVGSKKASTNFEDAQKSKIRQCEVSKVIQIYTKRLCKNMCILSLGSQIYHSG